MLECCASTKSRLEVDGLWWLEDQIVDGLGGWFVFEKNALPAHAAALTRGLTMVDVADYQSYFGAMLEESAYVAEYEEYVPRKRMYFIDARSSGFRHVDY